MVFIDNHISHDNDAVIKCGEEMIDNGGFDYRVLTIGEGANTFINKEQAEKVFDVLDKNLHKTSYSDLQDQVFSLQQELDDSRDLVQRLEDSLQENFA